MELSCAFATSVETPDHVAIAEELGYARAWLYDSPALYADVWAMLALAADRTEHIGLGPAVLVPSLRHPMVNAAAIAMLAELAPGRVAVALGAGFTGRYVMGRPPMRWTDVERYVEVLQALLRGEDATWDGATIAMIHPPGFVASRPIDVPILIGGDGPKGWAVAQRLGDGLFSSPASPNELDDVPTWRARLSFGTVLDDDERPSDERVLDAAGHGLAVAYHAMYERGGAEAVDALPGGTTWRAHVETADAHRRHLVTHENHLVALSDHDRAALRDGAPMIPHVTFTGTAAQLRERADVLAATGTTELVYQPAGPDIGAELARMAAALGTG
jgi:5,10-methylenetetrahydromethanopterin reductase